MSKRQKKSIRIIDNKEAGFALFEVVIVLLMLAVIGIIALPNLMNISKDLQKSSIEGIANIVKASAQLAKAQALAEGKDGKPNNNTITIDQKTIRINTRLYPVTMPIGNTKGIAERGPLFLMGGSKLFSCLPTPLHYRYYQL